nr:hypothetical protein Iba_chr13cCG13270 [Ipomoea batatas]GMD88421.1 hypothetical protein Iba_chr14cCG6870 [Ipomoea batatas]GMD89808.1 hypothetical protein Iba_chr14dCG3600 [Ipomoea batatas]
MRSPLPTSLIGFPETCFTLKAAPPLESPSSFDKMAPVIPISRLKVVTSAKTSWPVIASTTSKTSVGFSTCFTSFNSSIIALSI